MEFSSLTDLVVDVKIGVPGVGDNQALQALRRSARKFMNIGRLYEYTFDITLDSTQTIYVLPMPADVWIQDIIDQPSDLAFDGLYTVTFDSAYYATGDTFELKTHLGYGNDATDYPEWIIKRYFDGLIAGAQAVLAPELKILYNRIFHENLSTAMHFAKTFNGVHTRDSV